MTSDQLRRCQAGPSWANVRLMSTTTWKNVVQRVLGWAGYQLARADHRAHLVPIERRAETFTELEAMFRQFVFPELASTARRAELAARLEGTQTAEALYIVEYLHRSLRVPGDVCEFGVAQGTTSALLANELRSADRNLWLFDSFEGLSKPSAKDVLIHDIFSLGSMDRYEGTMSFDRTHVARRLRDVEFPIERVKVVPGFIEESMKRADLPGVVCFAYVDFDLYEPIRSALAFLDGVVPPGGHVVVDDYGWFSAGARSAVDEFVAAHRDRYELVLPLPLAGHFAILARR